ncbi:MAG: transporter substrate-binding domain-containing protein [Clostridium cochlearium]|uniref:transporter substrate-binding domain-containing protein n=1 Tax=Clostridium cochlearium TaxID=1494 RepID=UPI00280BB486|nr:transporter substrate-binding domain-containing protein [Clostridium cochlearium]MDU1444053.1 transporter substrate-binding domain-containing protein [Clostridium cochlearium]
MYKNKKKIIIILLLIVSVVGVYVIFQKKQNYKKEYDYSLIKVAGDYNFPPFEYISDNKNYTGFNVDIIRAVSLTCGLEVQFYPMDWDEACKKLKNGEIDLIQGMKKTQEREKEYDFSKPYFQNNQSIFILNENLDISKYEDLKGKKVALQKGDVAINNLKALGNVEVVFTKDQEDALKILLNKSVDAYIGNTVTGINYVDKLKIRDDIKIVDVPINSTEYSVAVKKGNTKLLNLINKGLEEIKGNGTYETVYRKWFGHDITYPRWYVRKVFTFTLIATVVSIILLLIFFTWNDILHKEVEKKTKELELFNKSLISKNNQIQEEKDFREQILNNIFNGIITLSEDDKIIFINKAAKEILRLNKDLCGEYFQSTYLKDFFDIDNDFTEIIEKKLELKENNTNDFYIRYRVNFINERENNRKKKIISFRDITEEKIMEENIRTKDKMHSLGTLVSGIAHEIRNPLTSIKMYTELIPIKYDNERFRERISKDIPLEIDRLNNIIKDLLEYSKPRKPFKQEINLLDELNKITMFLLDKLKKNKVNMYINVENNIYVYMDKNHFRQVMINLLINAIESTEEMGKINIYSKQKYEKIFLYIQDNGCGIEEKELNKLFNPFYTTKSEGTGLGLFVSYQLLTENNVKINIRSKKNLGSTFILEFKGIESDDNV